VRDKHVSHYNLYLDLK